MADAGPGSDPGVHGATLELVALVVSVYAVELLLAATGTPPVETLGVTRAVLLRPWTLLTSVYAHGSVAHLAGNLLVLAPAGVLADRHAARRIVHGVFLVAGVVGNAAAVLVSGLLVSLPVLVVGASGGVFGLLGFTATTRLADPRLDTGVLPFALAAVLLLSDLATGATPFAVLGHATGLTAGAVAAGELKRNPEVAPST